MKSMPYTLFLVAVIMLNVPVAAGKHIPGLTVPVGRSAPLHTNLPAGRDTVEWSPPRFSERKEDRRQMVASGVKGQGVSDPQVLEAMRQVPRHLFVPPEYRQHAYENRPLPIGYNQTISQPLIVGYMTQMLDLEKGDKVLEIGTGSGYQAAVLSELTPRVYTIEIVEALGRRARTTFDSLGYETIKTKIGDGYEGWPQHAPFDAIIVTAAAGKIPQPLIQQLRVGGVMAMPIGTSGETQVLTRITKSKSGELHTDRKIPVRFVPMTGKVRDNR